MLFVLYAHFLKEVLTVNIKPAVAEILEDSAVVCPPARARRGLHLARAGMKAKCILPSLPLSLLRPPLHLFLALPCQVGALDGLGSYAKEMKG